MFTSPKRPLKYPLRRSLTNESETPNEPTIENYPFSWPTEDNNEQVAITITLSLNEFIVLSSAIDVGSDIAYGQDAIQVWWLWVRCVKSMPLCDQIAACIATNLGVQNALSNFMSGTGSGGTGTGGDAGAGANTTIILTNNPTDILANGACDNDNMYAVATRITELAFEAVNQLYQVIDLAQSPLELASELADNAPALVTAAPATAGDFLVWVQNTAWNSWQVFDTSQRRIDVACDIFCIMVEQDCSLTFDDIFNYFAGQTVTAIFGVTLESIMLDLVDIFATDEVGYTSLAFLFGMLSLGSKVSGIQNVGGFLTAIAAYIDESNNNWTLECEPCVVVNPTVTYDFTINDGGFIQAAVNNPKGTYVANVGWSSTFNINEGLVLAKDISAVDAIDGIRIEYEINGGTFDRIAVIRDAQGSTSGQLVLTSSAGITASGCISNTIQGSNRNWLLIQMAGGASGTEVIIKKVVLLYSGATKPAGWTSEGENLPC